MSNLATFTNLLIGTLLFIFSAGAGAQTAEGKKCTPNFNEAKKMFSSKFGSDVHMENLTIEAVLQKIPVSGRIIPAGTSALLVAVKPFQFDVPLEVCSDGARISIQLQTSKSRNPMIKQMPDNLVNVERHQKQLVFQCTTCADKDFSATAAIH